jgi:hypothetical protein
MAPDRRLIFGGAVLLMLPSLLMCSLYCGPGPDALEKSPWVWTVLPQKRRDAEALERSGQGIMQRGEERRAVARDLAAGRLMLLEAAARVRDLDRADPAFPWEAFRLRTPGATDDERHCREVIASIENLLPADSPEREAALRRCAAELQEHLARGTLRLPEPRRPGPG